MRFSPQIFKEKATARRRQKSIPYVFSHFQRCEWTRKEVTKAMFVINFDADIFITRFHLGFLSSVNENGSECCIEYANITKQNIWNTSDLKYEFLSRCMSVMFFTWALLIFLIQMYLKAIVTVAYNTSCLIFGSKNH